MIRNITAAIADNVNMAANAVSVWLRAPAFLMTNPSPDPAPIHSPITAPITDTTAATFSPENR